jgi:MurNAc alpha-1-phosphate uridylyltransferase
MPASAMVLAAGLGIRMGALTEARPKPLIEVMGRALIDHVLDRLERAGVATAVVNVHHFADALEGHLKGRARPRIAISNERERLLDTGGGIVKALPLLGEAPFVLVNSDSLWIEGATSNLARLAQGFDRARMDGLLLIAATAGALGYDGRGDYAMERDGRLSRRGERETAPCVYAGAAILSPALFSGAPKGPFPLAILFERAEEQGRLYGLRLEGTFLHVGTPAAIAAAEQAIRRSGA